MSEWLESAFSGGVSLERVNLAGLALLLAAVVMNVAARPLSRRWPEAKREAAFRRMKIAVLLLACAGAAVALI